MIMDASTALEAAIGARIEGARDHVLRGGHEAEPDRLLVRSEHEVFLVEAMEVICDPNCVRRDRVRRAAGCRLRPGMTR